MAWGSYNQWAPYVSVAQKKAKAVKLAARIAKRQGRSPAPVIIEGRKIAQTFWGLAWCDNLEAYSDFANRLPRGATYVRNGSVADLVIKPRQIEAVVAGSEAYTIKITIDALAKPTWKKIKGDCSSSIDSLLDLLAGRFSDGVMQRLTQQKVGLFPTPKEIKMKCSCPDYSYCCKHLAAVMYAVGNRLDRDPSLLFLLRDVDHQELVSQAVAEGNLDRELSGQGDAALVGEDLGAMFGIDLVADASATTKPPRRSSTRARKSASPVANKVTASKTPRPSMAKRSAKVAAPATSRRTLKRAK